MKLDPVLAEIRAYREAYSERIGGDVSAMLADVRKREAESGRKIVNRSVKPIPTEASVAASMVELGKVKEPVMQVPVAVEPTRLGGFRAESVPPFGAVAEGNTREEAVSKIEVELNKQVEQGKVVMVEVRAKANNPWSRIAGSLKDNPLLDEWKAAMEEFRKQCDLEAGIDFGERP
jgi:hypothetical protein